MLPVTHGEAETRRQILLYTIGLVPLTLLIVPFGVAGWVYGIPALLLGGTFIALAVRLYRSPGTPHAVALFRYSILYLFLLYLCMTADALAGRLIF
jgi:protoheme IX farnesyltransferase